jgi:hypothetical protein
VMMMIVGVGSAMRAFDSGINFQSLLPLIFESFSLILERSN